MKRSLLVLLVVAGLVLVGCSGDDSGVDTDTDTVTTPVESTTVKAYFLRDGKVWPVGRGAGDIIELLPSAALDALLAGPSEEEVEELGAETEIPEGAEGEVRVEEGVAHVEVTSDELSNAALAQIVYTLTALPGVRAVAIDATLEAGAVVAASYMRADFEEQTPSVLVESPLAFQDVTAPITATGTANTFEATFQYELLDADGNVIDENFVTATSGTGTRGTFEFTTADVDGVATLVVFEASAEDGSRMREVEIPLVDAS